MIKKIKAIVDKLIEYISLHFIFILGIGSTFLIAKLFSKRFLTKNHSSSSWRMYLPNKNNSKMY